MKKILTILLIMLPGVLMAQSKLSDLSEDATISGNEYTYTIESGTSYKMSMTTLLNVISDTADVVITRLEDSCSALRSAIDNSSAGQYWNYKYGITGPVLTGCRSHTLYPKKLLNYANIWIGSEPPSSCNSYQLYVDGISYLADTATIPVIKLGTTQYLYDSLNTIYFRDVSQKLSLTQLTQLPTTLTANWTLNSATYDWSINGSGAGNGIAFDYSDGSFIFTANTIDFDVTTVTADSTYSTQLAADAVYGNSITLNDQTIDDWNDISGGGIGGTYVDGSSSGKDTLWMPVTVNTAGPTGSANDTTDYIPLVYDTLSSEVFQITLYITAANIENGDSLVYSIPLSTEDQIIPLWFAWQYTYTTDAFTSTDGTNSALLTFADAAGEVTLLSIPKTQIEGTTNKPYYAPVTSTITSNLTGAHFALDFYPHTTTTGAGTIKAKFAYMIADY